MRFLRNAGSAFPAILPRKRHMILRTGTRAPLACAYIIFAGRGRKNPVLSDGIFGVYDYFVAAAAAVLCSWVSTTAPMARFAFPVGLNTSPDALMSLLAVQ